VRFSLDVLVKQVASNLNASQRPPIYAHINVCVCVCVCAGVSVEQVAFKPHVTLLKTSKLALGAQKRFRHGISKKLWARHKSVPHSSPPTMRVCVCVFVCVSQFTRRMFRIFFVILLHDRETSSAHTHARDGVGLIQRPHVHTHTHTHTHDVIGMIQRHQVRDATHGGPGTECNA
jgi:hypothetical protein